jgi:hypothetical protein
VRVVKEEEGCGSRMEERRREVFRSWRRTMEREIGFKLDSEEEEVGAFSGTNLRLV